MRVQKPCIFVIVEAITNMLCTIILNKLVIIIGAVIYLKNTFEARDSIFKISELRSLLNCKKKFKYCTIFVYRY